MEHTTYMFYKYFPAPNCSCFLLFIDENTCMCVINLNTINDVVYKRTLNARVNVRISMHYLSYGTTMYTATRVYIRCPVCLRIAYQCAITTCCIIFFALISSITMFASKCSCARKMK